MATPPSGLNELLVELSDVTRAGSKHQLGTGEEDGPRAGAEGRACATRLRRASLLASLALSSPVPNARTLWCAEQVIIALQVRASLQDMAAPGHRGMRTAGKPLSVCSFVQVLSWPLSSSAVLLWGHTMLSSLCNILSLVSLGNLGDGSVEYALFWAAVAWAGLLITTFLGFLWATSTKWPVPHSVIQVPVFGAVARSTGYPGWGGGGARWGAMGFCVTVTSLFSQASRIAFRLSVSVLMIPFYTNLLRPLACKETWLTGKPCFTSAHLALTFMAVILVAATTPLLVMRKHTRVV